MRIEAERNGSAVVVLPARVGLRRLVLACAMVALVVGLLVAGWYRVAWAQEGSSCSPEDLGMLGAGADAQLSTAGQWSASDCDSRFRTGSAARTFRFEVEQPGRIRIDLKAEEADSFLYLLDASGGRIADNDDGGAGIDARVERDLTPGVYLLEATTVGGRARGPAAFSLAVSRVTGCDPVHLGSLQQGADLNAAGEWTLDTCGSRFVVEHPAHGYLFDLPQDGRVRIDLTSEHGDPVLTLVSPSVGLIAANDDGGERRNSRIERYLRAGTYMIEATTYLERDYQPLMADFELVVHLVDENVKQDTFLLKVEEVHTPEQVIAGQPFPVHFRVGNLGGGDLAEIDGSADIYVVGPRLYEWIAPIDATDETWQAGVSYHSGAQTASATSVAINEIAPFEATLRRPGPSWVFVAVITDDSSGNEVAFNGQWRNLMVLSGATFGPVTVNVDGMEYVAEAKADSDGMVTTTVTSVADPDADIEQAVRAKAIYAAGVQAHVLEGIFDRDEIVGISATDKSAPVLMQSPSSESLLKQFAARYINEVGVSGLDGSLAAEEALNPIAIEDLMVRIANEASAQFTSLSSSWSALHERDDMNLSFQEAFTVHSQFAYAGRVIAPAVEAGVIVDAARASDTGWEDPAVQAMIDRLAEQTTCGDTEAELRDGLEAAGADDVDDLLGLDAEMRAALPVYGPGVDAVLCAIADADIDNTRFLEGLAVDEDGDILELFGYEQPGAVTPAPPPLQLRILARMGEDGRIELGVELAGGEIELPTRRYLSASAPAGEWQISSDVNVDESPIGRVRSRWLDDGRVELGFLTASGAPITPALRYLPADIPTGVWLRSGEIEVVPEPALE